MGTTRPRRPGCRADSRVTTGREASVGRTASISSAKRARQSQRSKRASASRSADRAAALAADVSRELVEDPLLLGLCRQLGLSPGVGELDRDERLHEERLPAARLVVDDAPHSALGVGPHRHHVAAVAHASRGAPAGRREISEWTRASSRLRSRSWASRTARRRPPRAGEAVSRISPAGLDAGLQAGAQGRHRVEAAVQRVEQRALHLSQGVRQPAGRHERLDDGPQLRGVEATSALGTRHDGHRCRVRRRCRRPAGPRAASGPRRSRRDGARRRPGPPTAPRPAPGAVTARRPRRRPGAPGSAGTRAAPRSGRPSASAPAEWAAQGSVTGDAEAPRTRGPLRSGVGHAHPGSGDDSLARSPGGPRRPARIHQP